MHDKNKPGPAIAVLATWGASFAWLGWRGLVVAIVAGLVMSIGLMINQNQKIW